MKFITILLASSLLAASAFGVTPSRSSIKKTGSAAITSPLRKDSASVSPLFRDPTATRGGAVPGWAWYNEELDKHPLTAKACTSLVGWGLGDILAQVCSCARKKVMPMLLCWSLLMAGVTLTRKVHVIQYRSHLVFPSAFFADRSLLPEDPSTGSVSLRSPSLVSSIMGPADIISTIGLIKRFQEQTARTLPSRLVSISSFGAPSL